MSTRQQGLAFLEEHLQQAGVQVLYETGDRLVHLIARLEVDDEVYETRLRVKTSANSSFHVYRDTDNIEDSLIVLVWWAQSEHPCEVYAMTYDEAVAILEEKGYANSNSWLDDGWYNVSNPGNDDLIQLITSHQMSPDKWEDKLKQAGKRIDPYNQGDKSPEKSETEQETADVITDPQLVEILGRNRLVNELMAVGIETARPERDMGIDLIAYLVADDTFKSKPLQLKASSKQGFSINRKYERFDELLIVFIWGLQDNNPDETYALTYQDCVQVANTMGWDWKSRPYYHTSYISRTLTKALEPYRMTPDKWKQRILE